MDNFTFQRADSVSKAVAGVRGASDGKFLAGGQSLIPLLKLDLAAPDVLVSVAALDELKGVAVEGTSLSIGAGMTHSEVSESETVREAIPALAALASRIGDPQVRNRGTLGGSIAHADPAADYPAALLGLGATVVTDRREIAVEDFFMGVFETPLAPDELITSVRFPIPSKAAYAKFGNPASKYAVVGVMVAKTNGAVRVAVTGATHVVFRSAEMEIALTSDFSEKSLDGLEISAEGMISDTAAQADFRAHLVNVMARRAVAACG